LLPPVEHLAHHPRRAAAAGDVAHDQAQTGGDFDRVLEDFGVPGAVDLVDGGAQRGAETRRSGLGVGGQDGRAEAAVEARAEDGAGDVKA
jgi:hypothetical protein